MQPRFASDDELALLAPLADRASLPHDSSAVALADLVENLAGYTLASDREESVFAALVSRVAPAPVYRVPLLNTDVHDLDGLGYVADLLFGQDDA